MYYVYLHPWTVDIRLPVEEKVYKVKSGPDVTGKVLEGVSEYSRKGQIYFIVEFSSRILNRRIAYKAQKWVVVWELSWLVTSLLSPQSYLSVQLISKELKPSSRSKSKSSLRIPTCSTPTIVSPAPNSSYFALSVSLSVSPSLSLSNFVLLSSKGPRLEPASWERTKVHDPWVVIRKLQGSIGSTANGQKNLPCFTQMASFRNL